MSVCGTHSTLGTRGSAIHAVGAILISATILALTLSAESTPALAQEVAVPANESLSVDASIRFEVDPDAGSVVVEVDYVLTNTSDDQNVSEFNEHLPEDATGIEASSRGGSLDSFLVALIDDRDVWRISLASPLRPGRSTELFLTWVVSGDDPSNSSARYLVNPAYVSLPIFGVGGVGDLTSVEVSLPSDFQLVEPVGFQLSNEPEADSDDGRLRLTDGGRMIPYESATVMAVNDGGFMMRLIGDTDIEAVIMGWPGHNAWSTAMALGVRSMVPQLENWLGLPVLDVFEIREGPESAFPDLVAGSVVDGRLLAIVAPGADSASLGRQLSAAWFDAVLSDVEWFRVAAAEVYGTQAAQLMDPSPTALSADPSDESQLEYSVVDSLYAEIGPTAMADVIAQVIDGGFTYPGPGADQADALPGDWRTLLDAFEGIGGSSQAAELFKLIDVDSEGLSGSVNIDERAAARAVLGDLEDLAAGWELPIWVRLPMAQWEFDIFASRRIEVETTLAARNVLRESAVESDLDLGEFVRESFETASDGMAAVDALIESQSEALEAVLEVTEVVESNSGLISRIGLIGTDVDAELDRIRSMFESGEFTEAIERSHALTDTIEGSNAVGILRVVIPAVVVIAIVAGMIEIFRRRRSLGGLASRLRREKAPEAEA